MTFLRLLATVATWQCFACDTWNDGGLCTVCEYDPYGNPPSQG
ncbi:hypothetical protein [Nocardiopsis tropica]|uniref:RanBP2-type domain-containing protein n=1 Tax=Nocardiopsis tropica TaxID=109330 RepID=A0ABU7KQS4_9ACTN|nr:hypothetical protein [Nocardiopsis umidischolae]MEE2051650.1 hypothetical protein [Nocardiopsis umidischolae]